MYCRIGYVGIFQDRNFVHIKNGNAFSNVARISLFVRLLIDRSVTEAHPNNRCQR